MRKLRLTLIFLPFTFIALLPLINMIKIRILGVPLLWFWSFTWVVIITVIIMILYLLEVKEGRGNV